MGNKSTIERKSISDAVLKSELRKLFSKGITQKSNAYEQTRTKFKMTKQRFWNMFDVVHADWAKLKDKAESEGIIEATKEAAKTGLKSKLEKQLHIQKEIDSIQADIDRGILEDYVIVGGKVQVVNKTMNAETKAYLRKTIKDLYAELNKMDGDYAPNRHTLEGELKKEITLNIVRGKPNTEQPSSSTGESS